MQLLGVRFYVFKNKQFGLLSESSTPYIFSNEIIVYAQITR